MKEFADHAAHRFGSLSPFSATKAATSSCRRRFSGALKERCSRSRVGDSLPPLPRRAEALSKAAHLLLELLFTMLSTVLQGSPLLRHINKQHPLLATPRRDQIRVERGEAHTLSIAEYQRHAAG